MADRQPSDTDAEQKRQRVIATLRNAGLLPLAERFAFWQAVRERAEENAAFRAAHPDVPMPPLRWMHDMYAHASYRTYWRSGQAHATIIGDLVARELGPGQWSVAEWGCGMGRVTRHLEPAHHITGFDYNRAAIRWCGQTLSGRYLPNRRRPPLPVEDGSLDAVFGISVLTHLSAAGHEAWLPELARVVRPGGAVFLTVHGAPKQGQLLPEEAERFAAGKLVTRGRVLEGSRIYTSFQPEAYMSCLLKRAGFEGQRDDETGLGQTLWIGRR